jgi:hypothetical protein
VLLLPAAAAAQEHPAVPEEQQAPGTSKLEAFVPRAGEVDILASAEIGRVEGIFRFPIIVEAHETRSGAAVLRGVTVWIQRRDSERSAVDLDGLPDLIAAVNVLLETRENPTTFPNWEINYRTRGGLRLALLGSESGDRFFLQVGRSSQSTETMNEAAFTQFRDLLKAAMQRLAEP